MAGRDHGKLAELASEIGGETVALDATQPDQVEACLRRAAEVAFLGQGDDIAQFGEGHGDSHQPAAAEGVGEEAVVDGQHHQHLAQQRQRLVTGEDQPGRLPYAPHCDCPERH